MQVMILFQFKESVMDLMNTPSPAVFPECEKPPSVEYYERTGTVFLTNSTANFRLDYPILDTHLFFLS